MFWLASTTVTLVCLWLWKQQKRNPHRPPELAGGLPLLGHLHRISGSSKQLWIFFKKISYESLKVGGVLSVRLGPRIFYVITDPRDFQTLSNACLRKDKLYEFAKPWVGEGLVTGIPAIWKVHRKLLNAVFNQKVLDGFLDLFNSQSREFVSELKCKVGQGPFDHSIYIHQIVLETIFLTAFGMDGIDKDYVRNEYLRLFTEMFKIFTKRFQNYLLHHDFIFNMTQLKKKQEENIKILQQMSNKILERRKENFIKNKTSKLSDSGTAEGVQFKPFIDLLLELSINKGLMNDQEIREELDTLIGAGQDTVSTTVVYTILLIGSYPHVQEKILTELLEVVGFEDCDFNKHHLSKLVYLEAVIKESIRFYTVVPVFARYVEKDIKLSQYTLSGGTTCVLHAYGMHRHKTWGPDAEEFKPERWLDPSLTFKSASSFGAFSFGKRACIGKSFSLMLMKTILAHLIRNYSIKGDHTKMTLKIDLILKPDTGHFIEIEKRKFRSY